MKPAPRDMWTNWAGGAPPVDENTKVDVEFRSGKIRYGWTVKYAASWRHYERKFPGDIAAYRICLP